MSKNILEIRKLEGHTNSVTSVCVLFGGRNAVSSSLDGTLIHWDLEQGSQVWRLQPNAGAVNCMTVTPDGFHVLSAHGDGTLRLWNVEGGDLVSKFESHSGPVASIDCVWSQQGGGGMFALSGGSDPDRSLKLWNVLEGSLVRNLGQCDNGIAAVRLSAGRTWRLKWLGLAVDAGGRVYLRDLENGEEVFAQDLESLAPLVYTESIGGGIFGSFEFGTTSGEFVRWTTGTQSNAEHEISRRQTAATSPIRALARLNSVREFVITGDATGLISVWPGHFLDNWSELLRLEGHHGAVNSIAVFDESCGWLPAGTYILSGGVDGTARLWRIPF